MPRLVVGLTACCLACLLLVGCGDGGPSLGTVSGTVTMDGEPLPNVSVTFTPVAGGRGSTGKTDANGQYELMFTDRKGALLGEHKIALRTIREASSAAGAEMSSDSAAYEAQATGGTQADYDAATTTEPIPAKYNTATELTKEVKAGSNTIDLELTSS